MSYSWHRLLGFDIRVDFKAQSNYWTQKRRKTYLLNAEVEQPLSVDSAVWPSVFEFPSIIADGMPRPAAPRLAVDAAVIEQQLWLNLEAMRKSVRNSNGIGGKEIAIEILAETELSPDKFGSSILERSPTPSELPGQSQLAGYDLADAGFLSGLSNCAYVQDERLVLGKEWNSRLNAYGLFAQLADAIKFKNITDSRVREHAPFWVFALYFLD